MRELGNLDRREMGASCSVENGSHWTDSTQKYFEGFHPTLYEHRIGCCKRLALGFRALQLI